MAIEQIILGLGSNCEPRIGYLRRAIAALKDDPELNLESLISSQVYEGPALLPLDAPADWDKPYLNLVLTAYSDVSPQTLLTRIKLLERELGRQDRGWWGPREIDIDILAVGDQLVNEPHLQLPHAQMLKRDFVMIPLAEILPRWKHPADESARCAADYAAAFAHRTSIVGREAVIAA